MSDHVDAALAFKPDDMPMWQWKKWHDFVQDMSLYDKIPCRECTNLGDWSWRLGQCDAMNLHVDENPETAGRPTIKPWSVYDGECPFFEPKKD